jgi:hypothetical protein
MNSRDAQSDRSGMQTAAAQPLRFTAFLICFCRYKNTLHTINVKDRSDLGKVFISLM